MLNYFQKNDDGEDEVLSDATDKLLQSLEGESIKEYIIEENSNYFMFQLIFSQVFKSPTLLFIIAYLFYSV